MNWKNLKINKCPKCNKDFVKGLKRFLFGTQENMLSHSCGFQISEKKYNEIVTDQVTKDLNYNKDKYEN